MKERGRDCEKEKTRQQVHIYKDLDTHKGRKFDKGNRDKYLGNRSIYLYILYFTIWQEREKGILREKVGER